MSQRISNKICINQIKKIAEKYKINPRLITTRLMSEDDKADMRQGNLPKSILDLHVQVWIKKGMPNYREGSTIPMKDENSPVPDEAQMSEPFLN